MKNLNTHQTHFFTMDPLIELIHISKSFNENHVLKKISLQIQKGEILALLGGSGSGKSTLLKILLGVYKADSGMILHNGSDITKTPELLRSLIGLTTQENAFYDRLTVWENMNYYASLYKVQEKEKRIHTLLSQIHLTHAKDTLAQKLSGGMKRRLDFALSLLHDPEILILDEPTTGLDPLLVQQFWKIVQTYAEQKKTIIVITHILDEVISYCTRACMLKKGKLTSLTHLKEKDLLEAYT